MTDYINPDKLYPDDPARRIDNPPGNDSIRPGRDNSHLVDANKRRPGMNDLKAAIGTLQASIGLSQKFKASKPVIIPMETAKTALAALRDALRKQPDPITGMMPCGCGGVTEQTDFHDGFFPYSRVECLECGIQMMRAGDTFLEAHADVKRDWNTAMGWKGGAE